MVELSSATSAPSAVTLRTLSQQRCPRGTSLPALQHQKKQVSPQTDPTGTGTMPPDRMQPRGPLRDSDAQGMRRERSTGWLKQFKCCSCSGATSRNSVMNPRLLSWALRRSFTFAQDNTHGRRATPPEAPPLDPPAWRGAQGPRKQRATRQPESQPLRQTRAARWVSPRRATHAGVASRAAPQRHR